MFCNQCGVERSGSDRFCSICGFNLQTNLPNTSNIAYCCEKCNSTNLYWGNLQTSQNRSTFIQLEFDQNVSFTRNYHEFKVRVCGDCGHIFDFKIDLNSVKNTLKMRDIKQRKDI